MKWKNLEQERCSVARTVSVIGDRWTLLVLRDCFLGVRRFEEFQERLGISRPMLADRLAKLVEAGVLVKRPYQEAPLRHEYRLTPMGLDLHPVVMSIVHWGDVHMSGEEGRPRLHRHTKCGHLFDPVTVCSECHEPLKAKDVTVEYGPGAHECASPHAADAAASRPVRKSRRSVAKT